MSSNANQHDSAKQNNALMSSIANLNSAKHYSDGKWVIDIYEELSALSATELDLENCHAVCICQVPEWLSSNKKEAYIPQFVGLGPYHHFRADERDHDLIMTPKNKLAAARRVLKNLLPENKLKFQERISEFGSNIQTFFHPDVKSTYNIHTLSYVLIVDGLFLLSFINLLTRPSGAAADAGFSYFLTGNLRMPIFTPSGVELTENALIREVFKLENQIPFHVLKQISGVNGNEIQSHESDVKDLCSKVENFCKQNCPLVTLENPPSDVALGEYHHLLDFMYHLIVPKPEESKEVTPPQSEAPPSKPQVEAPKYKRKTCCGQCCSVLCTILLYASVVLVIIYFVLRIIIKQILRPFLWVLRLLFGPCLRNALSELEHSNYITNPALKAGVQGLLDVTKMLQPEEGVKRAEMIPSVIKLHTAGVHFQPAESGISSIKFDDQKCVFYLPCIRVDNNSDVIIRNLMAYETLFKSNNSSLEFTRYVELMRAIIDFPEDVKILVDNQIIKSDLRYEVITDLFNGFSKSTRRAKSSELEKVIHKVNAKFDSLERRKGIVNTCTSGKFIAALGGIVFLVFTALQTYCSIYNCSRTSKLGMLPQDREYHSRNNYFLSSM